MEDNDQVDATMRNQTRYREISREYFVVLVDMPILFKKDPNKQKS